MKKTLLIAAITLAIAGCDSDDAASNVAGSVSISGDATVGQTLSTTITDENGLANATVTYTWLAGEDAISGETGSSLTLTDSLIGEEVSVTASYTDDDGFEETLRSSETDPVASSNIPAVFTGDLTGAVSNDASDAITGTVIVTDTDEGESTTVVQTDATTTYGTFSITTAGVWTYTLDVTNTTVAALVDASDTVSENITITSADGTASGIAITVSGVDPDQVAKISDSDDEDTGELYYQFESGLNTGKLSLSILYGEDEEETAYISLYDTEGSTKSLIGELAFNEGEFGLRLNTFVAGTTPNKDNSESSAIDYDAIDAPDFTPGEWIDVVMTWDTSSTTDIGTYSIMIDDTTYGPFDSQHPTPGVLVESMTVRLSSNSSLSTDAIYVDDLNIYSDVAGTTAILEEDFESYTLGDSLASSNDSSPFGSRTFEAEVVVYGAEDSTDGSGDGDGSSTGSGGDDPTPGTAGNQIVQITDTDTTDAGELRLKLSTSDRIVKGKLTVAFNKSSAANCTFNANEKDAYIAIYGASTSSYDALVDLRIDGSDYASDYAIRKNDVINDKTVQITNATFTAETWTDVEITWDATAADDSTGPLITLSIDGTLATTTAWNSYSETLSDLVDGAQSFAFKLGDTSAILESCMLEVDNVKVYSTDAEGVDTIVFEDNFESYTDGASLHPDDGNSDLYNSATQEAVIATEND
jgi:VCBS repeat-containing protein